MSDLISEDPQMVKEVNKLLNSEARIINEEHDIIQEIYDQQSDKHKAFEDVLQRIREGQIDFHQCLDSILSIFVQIYDVEQKVQTAFEYWRQQILQKQYESKIDNEIRFPNNKRIKLEDTKNLGGLGGECYFFDSTQAWQLTREMQQDIPFFDKLRFRIKNHFKESSLFDLYFGDFIKLIFLFYESVITQTEFMELISDSLNWIEKEFIDEFRVMTQIRSAARKQQSNLFKPLKDTDFTNSKRLTKSYVAMHQGYAKNATQTKVLNQSWVSVPFGSEDYSFQIMRKNTYEEQLFKSEDERYEFDLNLQQMKRTMKLLQQIIDLNDSEKCQSQIKSIIDLRTIHTLYRNQSLDHHEIIQHLQTNPVVTSKVVIKRVQQKFLEIQSNRNSKAKLIWDGVSQVNFHRSLDHRSFYFKKNDKIFLNAVRFLKEPEERLKAITQHFNFSKNKDDVVIKKKGELNFHFNVEDLNVYLNTLDQLTSIKPQLPLVPIQIIPKLDIKNALQIPLFTLWFGDVNVVQETFQFLLQYIWIMGGANLKEKKQASRTIVKICNALFQIAVVPLDLSEHIQTESQLRQEVSQIEQKTQQINFNYVLPPQDEVNNQIPQNIIQQENKKRKTGDQNNNSGCSSPIAEEVPLHPETQGEFQSDVTEVIAQNQYPESIFETDQKSSLNFLPNTVGGILYVNPGLYTFIRLLNCIYQRLEIAKTISCNIELNEKTEKLNSKERSQLGLEKYQLFKSCLFLALRQKDFKYEDFLRSLFGKQGFIFSTLDKLLLDTCKQLILCHTNKMTSNLLNYSIKRVGDSKQFYKNFFSVLLNNANGLVKSNELEPQFLYELASDKTEDMLLANLSYQIFETQEKIHEKHIFRICYFNKSVFINLIPPVQKIQDLYELLKSHDYRDQIVQEIILKQKNSSNVYLDRNLRKSCRPRQLYSNNEIQWVIGEFKSLNLSNYQPLEDIIIQLNQKTINMKRISQQINVKKMMSPFK